MGLQNLSDSDPWLDYLYELMEQADLKGEATKCLNAINELATMSAIQVPSFAIGLIFSLVKSVISPFDIVRLLFYLMAMQGVSAVHDYYQRHGGIEDFLKSFLDEITFDLGQITGNYLSFASSMFMIAFGGAVKNGSITLGVGTMFIPVIGQVAAPTAAVAYAIGWVIQIVGLASLIKVSSSGSTSSGSKSSEGSGEADKEAIKKALEILGE